MAASNKETLYIDVDDEITSIIDKVKGSQSKIVALVLPKRATVLQSVVNMKLLKKAGTNAKKNIVLITSEKGLLPLAGVAGLHVAKSLQSKPVIPPLPTGLPDDTESAASADEPVLDKTATIGALAAASAIEDDTETIELDNAETTPATAPAATKAKKLKHLKVPNFERFRLGFFLAGLGIVLVIVAWYFAAVVMPRARVTITTNTTSAVSSFDFVASTTSTLDVDNRKLPAVQKEAKKTDSEKVAATGQKDMGTKAEGEVTLKLMNCSVGSVTVPSGTTVVADGISFVTQQNATMQSVQVAGTCRNNDFPTIASKTVSVLAAQNGEGGNVAGGKTFTVNGFTSVSGTNADDFTGGTSKLVKVVSQKDIDDAVTAIKTQQEAAAADELRAALEADALFAIVETRKAGEAKITATPALDAEAEETTITFETAYTMLGVRRDELGQLIRKDVEGEESLKGQNLSDDGIDQAVLRINNQPSSGEAFISLRTSVTAGPKIDEAIVIENIKGKKRGEAEAYIKNQPGVEDAVITYSPFWVYSTPKAASKITVVIEKTNDGTANDTTGNE
jgi:hypothetical protein